MTQFTVSVIGGLTLGAVYVLITLGMVLIYRATEVLNFAHGQFMLFAAYLVGKWQLETGNVVTPILLSIVAVAIAAALLYRFILRPTIGRPLFVPVIVTLGIAAVADGVMKLMFGVKQYQIELPGVPGGTVEIFGALFGKEGLAIAGFAIALAVVVVVVVQFTQAGARLRQAGQNPLLASQRGVNVHRTYAFSWAAAAALAAVAGITFGSTHAIGPPIIDLAFLAFPALLLGGMDSVPGALVGGLAMGLLQGFVASYFGGEYVTVTTYIVLLGVLLVRPNGLFGTASVTRV